MMAQAPPAVDLEWAVDEDMPPPPYPRDSAYVFRRVPELVTELALKNNPARVLDVACGLGGQLDLLRSPAREAWGLDASMALARHCRGRFEADARTPFVCAVAGGLPFRDRSFDAVVCQGSLDHFPQPEAFLREVARILRPEGRAVIGISNYDSLSCRVGGGLYRLKERFGRPVYRGRNFWQIPPNHTFRGTHSVLRKLGESHMELVECRGISMLWLFRRWTQLVQALPGAIAWPLLRGLDGVAYRTPALADIVVSVWRPRY